MKENSSELDELMDLVNRFIDFANRLKIEGSISAEKYDQVVKAKLEFLRENNTNEYKAE